MSVPEDTDFLGLRLIIHGVPLLGLLGRVRHGALTLSKLLRLAVRHRGCCDEVGGVGWRLRLLEDDVRTCRWTPLHEGLWEAQALST